MVSLRTRAFEIPGDLLRDLNAAKGKSVTDILHSHAGALGDYDAVKGWYKRLSREFNWVGATLMFNVVKDYHDREMSGDMRYRQTISMRNDTLVAYSRFLHLSRDTKTRRMDCTKVEETIIADPADLRDLALFRFMYDDIAAASAAMGRARVITELGVGLSQRKFRVTAKQAAMGNTRAQSLLNRDWVAVTLRFVERMGFTPTDVVVPDTDSPDATPQIRISRETGAATPLPLPAYTAENRICVPYENGRGLNVLRDYLQTQLNHTPKI